MDAEASLWDRLLLHLTSTATWPYAETITEKGGGPVQYMSTGSNLNTREVADC